MLCAIPLSTSAIGRGFQLDGGLDVCMDLTGSSPLTQTGMADFCLVVRGIRRGCNYLAKTNSKIVSRLPTFFCKSLDLFDAAQRKRGKYMDRCAAIRYGFLPFSFSFLGELRADAIILLKRIRKFFITQDI
ncbi:hypothetical protein Tco_0546299 [Tanacetum coccineum]